MPALRRLPNTQRSPAFDHVTSSALLPPSHWPKTTLLTPCHCSSPASFAPRPRRSGPRQAAMPCPQRSLSPDRDVDVGIAHAMRLMRRADRSVGHGLRVLLQLALLKLSKEWSRFVALAADRLQPCDAIRPLYVLNLAHGCLPTSG